MRETAGEIVCISDRPSGHVWCAVVNTSVFNLVLFVVATNNSHSLASSEDVSCFVR